MFPIEEPEAVAAVPCEVLASAVKDSERALVLFPAKGWGGGERIWRAAASSWVIGKGRITLADFSVSFFRLRSHSAGFTIVELMVVVLISGILVAVAVSSHKSLTDQARVTQAITDIYSLSMTIAYFEAQNGSPPESLADVGAANSRDPWGNPYEYLRIADSGKPGKGQFRKDHNMVPVNTDFDLYSKGKDGKSASPFTAKISQDDIVRAKDGAFVGLVSDY